MATQVQGFTRTQTQHSILKSLLWVAPLAMALTSVTNITLYVIAGWLRPEVTAWAGAGIGQIVGATVVYLLMGAVACGLMARYSSRPVQHYQTLAAAGLVLSLWLPLGAALGYGTPPGVPVPTAATAVALGLMHVVSWAISVPLFVKLAMPNR